MPKYQNALAFLSIATITITGTIPSVTTSATSCVDVEVIFARGSGQTVKTGEDYQSFKNAVQSQLNTQAPNVSTRFYDLGTSPHDGHQYPAVAISEFGILLGAYIASGNAFKFGQSVDEGVAEVRSYIDETSKSCSNTKYILAGFSQGAMVMSRALQTLNPEKILYTATFGDPKLYLPEGKQTGTLGKPLACAGKNLSNYRIDVPDCEVDQGILGALDPYQLTPYIDKLGTWCNEADFMCGSYFDLKQLSSGDPDKSPFSRLLTAHTSYKSDGSHQEAAKYIANAVAKAYPTSSTVTSVSTHHQNLAILLDVTASMTDLIGQYRTEALKIAQKVKDEGGTVAIYIYGDEIEDGFAPRILCNTECSLAEIEEKLNSISVDGGGDEPESALSALLHIMNTMTWHRGANKSIILLTDASYHPVDINGITMNDVVKRSYEIDPVNIFTITPRYAMDDYADLTSQTGGQTFNSTSEIPTSTETVLTRPYVNISEVDFTETPTATISSHEITYSGSSANIKLSSNASAYYLALGDAPLGIVTNHEFTLTDLPASTNLTITPINSSGRPGTPLPLTLNPPHPSTSPAQTAPKSTPTPSRNESVIFPKAPNCGIR